MKRQGMDVDRWCTRLDSWIFRSRCGSIVREPGRKGLGRNRQAESLTYTGSGSEVRRRTALAATLSGRFTLVYERSKTTRIVTVSNTDRAAPLVVESGRLTAHVGSNSKDRNWDTCVEPIEKPRVTSHSESNIFEFIACSLSLGRIGRAISRIAGEGRHRCGVSQAGAQPTRTTELLHVLWGELLVFEHALDYRSDDRIVVFIRSRVHN
jgi:hypothetical protein